MFYYSLIDIRSFSSIYNSQDSNIVHEISGPFENEDKCKIYNDEMARRRSLNNAAESMNEATKKAKGAKRATSCKPTIDLSIVTCYIYDLTSFSYAIHAIFGTDNTICVKDEYIDMYKFVYL
jgi:hypothetical protein